MPNGFATYMRLNTVMQSVTNAKVSPVLTSSMRHPIKSRNSLVFNMRHSMAQKVMKSGKSASTNGGDASRVGEMQKLIH